MSKRKHRLQFTQFSNNPTRREAKFTFPLYLGGGFLLGTSQWFYMLGPGIGVRL